MKKILIVLFSLCLLTACSVKKIDNFKPTDDNIKFGKEYNVSNHNPVKYLEIDEVLTFLKEGTGIIYFGFPECPWCHNVVPILLDALDERNIKEIYYFNPRAIRENNTHEYQALISLIGDYLYNDENEQTRLYVPDTYFIVNGKIIGHNNDTSIMNEDMTPELYFTDEVKTKLKTKFINLINKVYNYECNDCGQ